MSNSVKFTNICPIFISENIQATVEFYVDRLGFRFAKHFDKTDNFATIYKDSIEIVIVQKKKSEIENNTSKYGNGFDAYIDTDSIEGIDIIYKEYYKKGIKIISEPKITDYGSYEFVFEDIDGRHIGIGLIKDKDTYFKSSNYI